MRPRERSPMPTLWRRPSRRSSPPARRWNYATDSAPRRLFEASDLPTIADQHLHTAVHNEEQLAALETAELSEPVTVWMKLDTGMHRLGVRPESAEAFYQRLCQCKMCVSR